MKETNNIKKQLISNEACISPLRYDVYEFFQENVKIYKNSILLLEPFKYHYECSPGFSKYFIDLGYNVDIIMKKNGIILIIQFLFFIILIMLIHYHFLIH